ncbi:MAG: hypothetical protein LBG11_05355 [Bifidobacteriaceae bacterium]|jgi:hypothetical protein|nr:hypothetical protein [Bifidobacteriaceae bacterium]
MGPRRSPHATGGGLARNENDYHSHLIVVRPSCQPPTRYPVAEVGGGVYLVGRDAAWDAFATANAAGAVNGWRVESVEHMFDWNLVEPRVVYSFLSAPFVRHFGWHGMLVVSISAAALFFGLMAWALRRRFSTLAGLATMVLVLACSTWFYYAVAALTESLSALWFALALGAAWRYRCGRSIKTANGPSEAMAETGSPRGWLWLTAACQVFQVLVYPYSPEQEWLLQTGWQVDQHDLIGVVQRLITVVRHGAISFLASDSAMAMAVLLLVIALLVGWRRVETHLAFGALAGGLVYQAINGALSTGLRYCEPGWFAYVLAIGALMAWFDGIRGGPGRRRT